MTIIEDLNLDIYFPGMKLELINKIRRLETKISIIDPRIRFYGDRILHQIFIEIMFSYYGLNITPHTATLIIRNYLTNQRMAEFFPGKSNGSDRLKMVIGTLYDEYGVAGLPFYVKWFLSLPVTKQIFNEMIQKFPKNKPKVKGLSFNISGEGITARELLNNFVDENGGVIVGPMFLSSTTVIFYYSSKDTKLVIWGGSLEDYLKEETADEILQRLMVAGVLLPTV